MFFEIYSDTTDSTEEESSISISNTKWHNLKINDLIDIYGVHKAMKFGQYQRADYGSKEFLNDLERAEKRSFGEAHCALYLRENVKQMDLSFYPEYLVNDDVFQVMACHFAVSHLFYKFIQESIGLDGLHVRSVVVPALVSSRYDIDHKYLSTINNIREFLNAVCSSQTQICRQIRPDITRVPELASTLLKMVKSAVQHEAKNILLIFDRQNLNRNGQHPVYIMECQDWSVLTELEKNYFISFDFEVNGQNICKRYKALFLFALLFEHQSSVISQRASVIN